jgi:hypothetical protein
VRKKKVVWGRARKLGSDVLAVEVTRRRGGWKGMHGGNLKRWEKEGKNWKRPRKVKKLDNLIALYVEGEDLTNSWKFLVELVQNGRI